MSIRKLLGRVFLSAVLQAGALTGSVTPEEIEKIMQVTNATKVEFVVKNEDGED